MTNAVMKPGPIAGLLLSVILMTAQAAAADVHGGGGTAVYPVLSIWAQDYRRKTGVAVNYQTIGSGGGIRQSMSRTIDFGNTDKPLDHATLLRNRLFQCPIVIIAIVPVVNLPGIGAGELTLDGATLAGIYLGQVTRWDDAAIRRLNPGVPLPRLPIVVVHRSDASGTTFNFTAYLSKVSASWKAQVGADAAVDWPLGSAAIGNAGVVATLSGTKGAIAYVEYAYAQQNRLSFTGMVNHDGGRALPDTASFQAAAGRADFSASQDFRLTLIDPPGRTSWPMVAASYMLLRTDAPVATNRTILRFLDYGLNEGRPTAEKLHYVPLPERVVRQVEAAWTTQLHAWP
jgi:phosphate transport system substrate-binding protein